MRCMQVAGLLLSVWMSVLAAPVWAAQPTVIVLEPYLQDHLSLVAETNGGKARFLFDTAAGISVVTPQFAQRTGCTPWGRFTGFRMRGDRIDTPRCDEVQLRVSGLDVISPLAGVWDFTKMLPKEAPPLDGIVALDVFAGKVITVDLGARQLIVETPASFKRRIRGAIEVPTRISREKGITVTPFVAVHSPQGKLWMELDSGSDASLIVGQHAAASIGLDPAQKKQPADLQLVGGVPLKTTAMVADLIMDGNIGSPVLRTWVITLDLAQGRTWIRPRAIDDTKPAPAQ